MVYLQVILFDVSCEDCEYMLVNSVAFISHTNMAEVVFSSPLTMTVKVDISPRCSGSEVFIPAQVEQNELAFVPK